MLTFKRRGDVYRECFSHGFKGELKSTKFLGQHVIVRLLKVIDYLPGGLKVWKVEAISAQDMA